MKRLFKRTHPGSKSMKEAFDFLPSGICFFDSRGLVVLCNRQMHRLCFALSGSDFQSLPEFRKKLESPENAVVTDGVHILPDGRVWRFSEYGIRDENNASYTQMSAMDITDIYRKQEELRRSNESLAEMNEHLSALSRGIHEIVREEETLAMKIRVHDDIGRSMIAARRCLAENAGAEQIRENCRIWDRTVNYLNRLNNMDDAQTSISAIAENAADIGVTLCFEGELPEFRERRELIAAVISECASNTVRHAHGNKVYVKFDCYGETETVTLTNDGAPPKGEITEGGGLSTLRRRIESTGGNMKLCSFPRFKLWVCWEKRAGARE